LAKKLQRADIRKEISITNMSMSGSPGVHFLMPAMEDALLTMAISLILILISSVPVVNVNQVCLHLMLYLHCKSTWGKPLFVKDATLAECNMRLHTSLYHIHGLLDELQ
jgi:hypothetical protein